MTQRKQMDTSELFKQALELMKDAELQHLAGPEKLKFVQDCLRTFVRSKSDLSAESRAQALEFIDTTLPGAIELAVSFSKLKFVQQLVQGSWCCWK